MKRPLLQDRMAIQRVPNAALIAVALFILFPRTANCSEISSFVFTMAPGDRLVDKTGVSVTFSFVATSGMFLTATVMELGYSDNTFREVCTTLDACTTANVLAIVSPQKSGCNYRVKESKIGKTKVDMVQDPTPGSPTCAGILSGTSVSVTITGMKVGELRTFDTTLKLKTKLDIQLRNQLSNQLYSQSSSQLKNQLHIQLIDQLYTQLDIKLHNEIHKSNTK